MRIVLNHCLWSLVLKTYELIVNGRVQGVNYRKFVIEVAQTLSYTGYVQNTLQKTVRVIVNAEFEEDLEFFISKLYEGPLFSCVTLVTCQRIETQLFKTFSLKA